MTGEPTRNNFTPTNLPVLRVGEICGAPATPTFTTANSCRTKDAGRTLRHGRWLSRLHDSHDSRRNTVCDTRDAGKDRGEVKPMGGRMTKAMILRLLLGLLGISAATGAIVGTMEGDNRRLIVGTVLFVVWIAVIWYLAKRRAI